MRWSNLFIPTLKETPSDAETASHQLMLRAGMIRKLGSGIYDFLPAGVRVLNKISDIIREELNAIGCQEVILPILHPAELWQKTGRWDKMDVLFRLKDRGGRDMLLGPTHEEIITTLVAQEVKSYRQLPVALYQIQTKFRDEPRPRNGIIRAREFLMMDLYSFHRTKEDLEKTYWQVYEAYKRIYDRCGFDIRIIDGETGDIGGDVSHQFELITDSGEDTTLLCPKCSYGADIYTAKWKSSENAAKAPDKKIEKTHTPNLKTVEQVIQLFGKTSKDIIKTLVYEADGKLVLVCIRGDREINELRLKKFLGAKKLVMASDEKANGLALGFVGPVDAPKGLQIIGDPEIKALSDAICGANEKDYHLQHVAYGRDFTIRKFENLRLAAPGDPCPRCGTPMEEKRGIELGQTFILGTIYSEPLDCKFLDEDGSTKPMIMGTYGIGVSRMIAALIEQHHDQNGIQWPVPVAPFDAVIVPVNMKDETQVKIAEALYNEALKAGLGAILDDRDVRAGFKFKDTDLIGFPFRITVGQKASENKVELFIRKENRMLEVPAADAIAKLLELRQFELERYTAKAPLAS